MATLTYIFYDDVEPSEKDPMLWERAEENGLTVEQVPDLYPGVAGELQISGNPEDLRALVEIADREGLPGNAASIRFDENEADSVARHFSGTEIVSELNSPL